MNKTEKMRSTRDDPLRFRLPSGHLLTLPPGESLDDEQVWFIEHYLGAWERGALAWVVRKIQSCHDIPKAKRPPGRGAGHGSLHQARDEAIMAFGLILARSKIGKSLAALQEYGGTRDFDRWLHLFSLVKWWGTLDIMDERGQTTFVRDFFRLIHQAPGTRRIIADMLTATSAEHEASLLQDKKAHGFSTSLADLFKPALNLDYAIVLFWAHPGVHLCRFATKPKEAYDRFGPFQRAIQRGIKRAKPSDYHQFYNAAQRLGLIQRQSPRSRV